MDQRWTRVDSHAVGVMPGGGFGLELQSRGRHEHEHSPDELDSPDHDTHSHSHHHHHEHQSDDSESYAPAFHKRAANVRTPLTQTPSRTSHRDELKERYRDRMGWSALWREFFCYGVCLFSFFISLWGVYLLATLPEHQYVTFDGVTARDQGEPTISPLIQIQLQEQTHLAEQLQSQINSLQQDLHIAKEQLRIQQQEAQQAIKQLQQGNKDAPVPASLMSQHGDHDDEDVSTIKITPVDPGTLDAFVRQNELRTFMFGDDYIFFTITNADNHALVQRAKNLWGTFIKKFMVFSVDSADVQGFIKIDDPHPTWEIADIRYASWRIPKVISYFINKNIRASMYIYVEHHSFPLLDRMKYAIDLYKRQNNNEYPFLAVGPKKYKLHPQTIYTQQHTKLDSLPTNITYTYPFAFGFNRRFLEFITVGTDTNLCPVLYPDGVTLGGMIECAGRASKPPITDWPDITQWNMFPMSRKSPQQYHYDDSTTLTEWQKYMIYHKIQTIPQLEQIFLQYFSKALA